MATTLKMSISPDSPQCEKQCVILKISILQNFSKHSAFVNTLLQTIAQTAPTLLTLDVTVLNTINTHKFCPASYLAGNSKFHHSISWLTLAFTNLCQLVFISFLFCACTAVQIVSFKNSPTNYCCFGTSTTSPWAKAMFLHMYLF